MKFSEFYWICAYLNRNYLLDYVNGIVRIKLVTYYNANRGSFNTPIMYWFQVGALAASTFFE